MAVVPSTLTSVPMPTKPGLGAVSTYYIDYLIVSNVSASATTITLSDNSTNCGGSACQILSSIPVQPGQMYVIPLYGVPAPGGVKWSSGTASALQAWVRGRF
jgi:hypothetical protein